MGKVKKVLFYGLGILILVIGCLMLYVKYVLPDVAAAPYLQVDTSPERIERGKYLCHSCGCLHGLSFYKGLV